MGNNIVTSLVNISNAKGVPHPETIRSLTNLFHGKPLPEKGMVTSMLADLDDLLPSSGEIETLFANMRLVKIGLAALGGEGHRVLSGMKKIMSSHNPPLVPALAGDLSPRSVLREAGIRYNADCCAQAERKFPGCLVAGHHMIVAWVLCQEVDKDTWLRKLRESRSIDPFISVSKRRDNSFDLLISSFDDAPSLLFRALAAKLSESMLNINAVGQENSYSYSAVSEARGVISESETWDRSEFIRIHKNIFGCEPSHEEPDDPGITL